MQKNREFRSLLTIEEYSRLMEELPVIKNDIQTNHYYDTPRFSLKAQDMFLKVKEREGVLELSFKFRKAYQSHELTRAITKKELQKINATGIIPFPDFVSELTNVIREQKLVNFLSLSTTRNYSSYASGVLFIDENRFYFPTIVDDGQIAKVKDYEIEYEAKTYENGVNEFISLIKDYELDYKKTDKKLRRAFNTYKQIH